MFDRQVLEIVRCRATSCAVTLDHCQGGPNWGQCPYYGGMSKENVLKCAYDPAKPKRVLNPDKTPRANDRESFVLPQGYRPKVHRLFAVSVPDGPNEWDNAKVNK